VWCIKITARCLRFFQSLEFFIGWTPLFPIGCPIGVCIYGVHRGHSIWFTTFVYPSKHVTPHALYGSVAAVGVGSVIGLGCWLVGNQPAAPFLRAAGWLPTSQQLRPITDPTPIAATGSICIHIISRLSFSFHVFVTGSEGQDLMCRGTGHDSMWITKTLFTEAKGPN